MKILYVSSEIAPYAKTGGLGDVARDYPNAMAKKPGIELRLVMPLYSKVQEDFGTELTAQGSFITPMAHRALQTEIFKDGNAKAPIWFLQMEDYFDRPHLYGYRDDAERFAAFSRAVLELALRWKDWTPDLIHCNDWQTALIPVFRKAFYDASDLHKTRVLLTVHNALYQGRTKPEFRSQVLGLSSAWDNPLSCGREHSLLKAGLETADRVNTVSGTYAQELMDSWYAQGLESVFRQLGSRFSGIENGIDPLIYDPMTDPALFCSFSRTDLLGKLQNKRFLQKKLGFALQDNRLFAGMVTRLTEQKGLDLVRNTLPQMMAMGIQLVVLGAGQIEYESFFRRAQEQYPGQVSVHLGFDSTLASQIYAGADLFLMPSKTEPCGLAQLIAMRYGAIPLVRQTGGLKDTVPDWDPETNTGFGFSFRKYKAAELLGPLERVMEAYRNPELWHRLVRRAMAADHSWQKSADQYYRLYTSMEREDTK